MGEKPLIAAVRRGDAKTVETLLEAGADPNTVDEHGTPALCLAVDAFDLPVAEVLMPSAWLNCTAADGRTPLLRAIDLGDHSIAAALTNRGAHLWPTDAEGRDALELARYWHTTGAETELRRRSGSSAPAGRRTVREESGTVCEELSLGGLTVRTGHAAILTDLESKYGVTPSFAELMKRALAEPDVDHEVWWATTHTLRQREDPSVWDAAGALRDRPDPLERYFGALVLRLGVLFDMSDDESFVRPIVDHLLPWAARGEDPRVMRELTAGLSDALDPRATRALPALTRHHDAEVRRRAVSGLQWPIRTGNHQALAAVVACTRDADAAVRVGACKALGDAPTDALVASDALAVCLHDEDEAVRVTAAVRLALRDDPRGDEVLRSVNNTAQDSPYYWDLHDVWRHRQVPNPAR
ncbi:HEAT repeat domain-containing protein [Streptomyces olivoreticuli]|uniref:ankyrin repeat domain-containing protein n=1 Tax=Streptomyces olivoreticuli TaxID=68246 RepID=UPI00265A4BA1|nr:ankyrin repeat domain-containing protein [Streptomyces olivoreticuli]WKK23991.1 HEAT repeat domain-containing protein [Streptomyces olivoreticuli]